MAVKIKVKTTIFHEDGCEVLEAEAQGSFYQKKNASFLQYEEMGEAGRIRTIVKTSGNEALILRSGAVNMRLPFAIGRKLSGSYELPFGKFAVASLAKRIESSYFAESGKGYIDILYDFSMKEADSAGTYHLEITFQEEVQ